jgi:hypothetical protein
MIRRVILTAALIAGSGAAWAQTISSASGNITLPPGEKWTIVPCPPGIGAPMSAWHEVTSPPHPYTAADLERMRAAERAINRPCTLSTECEVVIELRVQTDLRAGVTPDDLEAAARVKP